MFIPLTCHHLALAVQYSHSWAVYGIAIIPFAKAGFVWFLIVICAYPMEFVVGPFSVVPVAVAEKVKAIVLSQAFFEFTDVHITFTVNLPSKSIKAVIVPNSFINFNLIYFQHIWTSMFVNISSISCSFNFYFTFFSLLIFPLFLQSSTCQRPALRSVLCLELKHISLIITIKIFLPFKNQISLYEIINLSIFIQRIKILCEFLLMFLWNSNVSIF